MKFKMVVLAAALTAAGQTQAQSKVELYGVVDVNVEVYNHAPDGAGGKHTVAGMRSGGQSGSRWGLRGAEDLGDGLKAVFAIEAGFNVANGRATDSQRIFNRQAFVGLQDSWGSLTFGRQYTPSHTAMVNNSPSGLVSQYEPVPYLSPGRGDNMILYQGTFSGFTVSGYYGFSEQGAQMLNDQSATGRFGGLLGYNYQNRVRLMAAYDRIEDGNFPAVGSLPAANRGKADNWLFGARGDFGPFYVLGGYRHRRWEMNGAPDIKSELFVLGAGYRYRERSLISVGYFYDKLKNAPAAMTQNAVRKSRQWQQLGIFGTYALGKRTNLYAAVAYSHNGALNMGYGGDGGTYALGGDAKKQAGGAIGIRHVF